MTYKALIRAAAKRTGMKRHAIGRALGYVNKSAIYDVEAGRKGISGTKLMKLMEMAGKGLAILLTAAALTLPSYDVQAATKVTEKPLIIKTLYIMSN
jgi:hypothetical protein